MPLEHPLGAILDRAARGEFPPADGAIRVLPRTGGPTDAVVSFSAHSLIVTGIDPEEIKSHLPDPSPASPMSPTFLAWLAREVATPAGLTVVVDMVMVAFGDGTTPDLDLVKRDELLIHPRAVRSTRYRRNLQTYSDREGHGVVILGNGLADRTEVAIEVDGSQRGKGFGTALARAALSLVPAGQPVFAQVTPGNVASIRAFLRAGYLPICSEIQFPLGL